MFATPEGQDRSPKPRRRWPRWDARTLLIPVWIALLLWAAGLAWWWTRLERAPAGPAPVAVRLATPTPRQAQEQAREEQPPIATPAVAPVAWTPGPAAARGDLWQVGLAFDEERAFAWIKTLTGPPYLGRRAGSPQGHAAAEAIAQAFAEMGLQPAGPGGSYFQPFPVVHTWLAQVPSLVVTDATGQRHGYRFHQDFAPLVARYVGGGVGQGPVLWVGSCTHDDFDGVDAVGKVVFCREPPRREDAGRNALEHGAVGLLILTDPAERPLDRIGPYGETWVPMPLPALRVAPRVAEDLLAGSGLTLDDLTLQFAAVPLPSTAHLEIAVQVDEEAQGRNVLAVLPGRDLAHADEVVIVGAHYDHVGQDPDGTVWPGANDNASGTAALLEIARTWQKEGVVPRRTVLFAAWDAEELGLVGSRYYVEHPSYPLTQTVAMLNLDMVGAGEDILYVDGTGPVARHLAHLAGTLGITVTPTDGGRSDHSSFTEAGVPAAMPIWFGTEGGSDAVAHYHRPADTPAVIEPAKLAAAGRLANLTLLHLAEAEPAVLDLVRSRAEAAAQGDATSFLATSASWRAQEDRGWLEALSSLQPSDFALEVRDVIFGRDVATATVHMRVAYPGTDGREASRSATLPVRLERGGEGWRWAGPALVWQPPEEGIAVAFPPGREGAVEGLAPLAAAELRRVGELLHLPAPQRGAALLLYPDARALQADVAFAAPADAPSWVGTCTAPLGEGWGLATCARLEVGVLGSARPVLTDTLAQLALAQAGLREEMAPWLWHGLPPALGAQDAPLAVQPPYLEALAGGTGEGTDEASAWAAVEFARERVGWEGLGRLVRALAQGTPPEEAFHAVLGMGSADFEDAWRAHWRARLEEVQDGAAALFQARQQALQAGDLESFLRTVDRRDSLLEAAERRWFARWRPRGAEGLSLEAGQVLAFVDGGVVVQATLRHEPGGEGEEAFQATFPVLLRRQGEGYIWAGAPLATLEGGRARVLYPAGRSAQAQAFLAQAEAAIPQLASLLGREPPPSLTCILYDDGAAFRAAVAPGLPEEVEVWAEPGLVRLWLRPGAAEEDLAFALARGVAEALLWEAGLEQAWLRAGLAAHAAEFLDGVPLPNVTARYLPVALRAAARGTIPEVDALLAPEEDGAAPGTERLALAWDAARHLVERRGWEGVQALLDHLAAGQPFPQAFAAATGLPPGEFAQRWRESLARGHALPAWVTAASRFDGQAALAHVEELAGPAYAGRQPGSPGGQRAAAYIAEQFAQLGLAPAGEDGTFFQRFPISYTTFVAEPRFALLDGEGREVDALAFREDFVPLFGGTAGGGQVEAPLVWVRAEAYGEMRLGGKVVLRESDRPVQEEAAEALAHGAGGLILSRDREGPNFQAKAPLPVTAPLTETIPVVEVSAEALERIVVAGGHTLADIRTSPPAMPLPIRVRLEVPLSPPVAAWGANVLGALPGRDPARQHEWVILGAHYDHVGDDPAPGRRYPGANDNASGVAVLLEIARLWREAGYWPSRSVLFAAWDAQEPGQVGSSFYVAHPTVPLTDTVAMWQLDAVGGSRTGYYLQAQGDRANAGENLCLSLVDAAAKQVEGRLDVARPLGQSDEHPFREAQIPALLFVWKGADERNLPSGEAEQVDPQRLATTGRTVALALMMLAR